MLNQPHTGVWRIPFVQRCDLETGRGPIEGLVCNLGTRGAYVSLDDVPELRERVRISFPFPGTDLRLSVEAEVAWRNSRQALLAKALPPGCGLKFVTLSPTDEGRIRELVRVYRSQKAH